MEVCCAKEVNSKGVLPVTKIKILKHDITLL